MNQTIPGFRDDCSTIEGFHNYMPECGTGEAIPDGFQHLYCKKECWSECQNECQDKHNPERCMNECQKERMKDCLFVPCCTRESMCDDGLLRVRELCQWSLYDNAQTSEWADTGCSCGG